MPFENVVTVGIQQTQQSATIFSSLMQELRRLVETAGGQVVREFSQKRDRMDPAFLIGKGKAQELGLEIKKMGIKTVVFDDDLTAAQQKNIEKLIPAKIIDRTRLILDIFARRAHTKEGQLQIELAQLNYLVPRLTGSWRGYSQQVGGIGTRGPGERKIEVERRYVRERIKRLKKEIEDIKDHRERARSSREKIPLPQMALIGYTNVGKSTLLNALVKKENAVYADDKLFATLDPTTRRVKLPGGRAVLFTDTVGFIQKLPHDLVAAFRATLEEATNANLLIHLVDPTADDSENQQKTVLEVIRNLGADTLPMITVYNKADQLSPVTKERMEKSGATLVSGKTGEGISALMEAIEKKLDENLVDVTLELPHNKQEYIDDIYRTAHILSQKPTEKGTWMRLKIDSANWQRLSKELKLEVFSS